MFQPSLRQRLQQAHGSIAFLQMLYIVVRLGIAEHLADTPKSITELARLVKADEGSLYRLMRSLASMGVFFERADSSFTLTHQAKVLLKDDEDSIVDGLIFANHPAIWKAWGQLLEGIQSNHAPFEIANHMSFFDYAASDSELGTHFNRMLAINSEQQAQSLLKNYDFTAMQKIVDIGGGHGVLLKHILAEYPHIKGIIFDTPTLVQETSRLIRELGLSERCTVLGGSFFKEIPQGADLYILKRVLHNWNDKQAIDILKACRSVLSDSAKLLLVEIILPDNNATVPQTLMDMTMFTLFGGIERSKQQWEKLLSEARMRIQLSQALDSNLNIIEVVPVG
jgi:hypothetical protein